jgi:hypothetical protein
VQLSEAIDVTGRGLIGVRGLGVTGIDPRFTEDVHLACPLAVAGTSSYPGVGAAPWVREVVRCVEWLDMGGALTDIEGEPTQALIDAAGMLRRELKSVERQTVADASKDRQGAG